MKLIRKFLKDERAAAAVEMGLIAPFLAGFAVMSMNVWDVGMRKQDMKGALKLATQYYMNGGTDDDVAETIAMSSWQRKPDVAEITATRICRCGTVVAASCTTLCADGMPPSVYVQLHATATSSSAVMYQTQTADEYVRVR